MLAQIKCKVHTLIELTGIPDSQQSVRQCIMDKIVQWKVTVADKSPLFMLNGAW